MQENFVPLMRCPSCFSSLNYNESLLKCNKCNADYPESENIPNLYQNSFGLNSPSEDLASEVVEANEKFHNYTAQTYDNDRSTAGLRSHHSTQRLIGALKFLSEKSSKGKLLDIGCGSGRALQLAEGLFQESLGVDVSLEMIKIARSKNQNVMLANALNLPFVDESFDAVTCLSVLHHTPKPTQIIFEILRVLKKNSWGYIDFEPNFNAYNTIKKSFYQKVPIINKFLNGEIRYSDDIKKLYKLSEFYHTFEPGLNPELLKKEVESKADCEFHIHFVDQNSIGEPYKICREMLLFYVFNFQFLKVFKPEFSRYFAIMIKKTS